MHKFVQWIFASFINVEKFLRVLCLLLIMLISLYWVQNIIEASWWWMMPIAPLLDCILDFVNSIYSFSFELFGKTFDMKYFNAVILIVILISGLKFINIIVEKMHEMYEDAHLMYKKTHEKIFNNNLENAVRTEEKQINDYMVYIQTRVSKKHLNKITSVDINEETSKIIKFINEKTKTISMKNWEGHLYLFKNIEHIDDVLEVLFRVLKSPAPIDYMICVQAGSDAQKLKQLVDLEEWGKIIMSADTLCRYEFNNVKMYKTTSVGIFQREENTLEVHEFVEKL